MLVSKLYAKIDDLADKLQKADAKIAYLESAVPCPKCWGFACGCMECAGSGIVYNEDIKPCK